MLSQFPDFPNTFSFFFHQVRRRLHASTELSANRYRVGRSGLRDSGFGAFLRKSARRLVLLRHGQCCQRRRNARQFKGQREQILQRAFHRTGSQPEESAGPQQRRRQGCDNEGHRGARQGHLPDLVYHVRHWCPGCRHIAGWYTIGHHRR